MLEIVQDYRNGLHGWTEDIGFEWPPKVSLACSSYDWQDFSNQQHEIRNLLKTYKILTLASKFSKRDTQDCRTLSSKCSGLFLLSQMRQASKGLSVTSTLDCTYYVSPTHFGPFRTFSRAQQKIQSVWYYRLYYVVVSIGFGIITYVVGSKCFRPDIQKPSQMENAVRNI